MRDPLIGKTTRYYRHDPPMPSRCRVAVGAGMDSSFRGAIGRLLHRRLRVVVLIALLPNLLFLVHNLIDPPMSAAGTGLGLSLHLTVALLMGGLAVLVWSRPAMTLCSLRWVEMVLFGSIAAYFAWMQYENFAQDMPFGMSCRLVAKDLVRVSAVSSTTRWFFLIVIYGVFIPNTWKRCALLTGIAALVPLVLTPAAASLHGHLGLGIWVSLPDMAIMMMTAVAVAVFGSYRLQHLEEQAFEAQQLGQYRLKKRLGSGGMGEVFLGEHLLLRRPCAIKLIRPEQAGDPTTLQRFEREVQAMARLTHPNTVEVYDYGHADDGTFYYVMEYLPGQTLEDLVTRYGPLPAARVIHFLRQVCGALREAHGRDLLHRDVKPSNILVCERGSVQDVAKLLDFGLVQESRLATRDANRLTVQGTIVGSPPYMSPEQAAGQPFLDARSDVYNVGGVAYFLLTGQPPFPRETAMQMLLAHAYEPVMPPSRVRPGVPDDLEAVVLRCLEKDPARRFPDADSLDRALAACRDAGGWDPDQAAAWWKDHPRDEEIVTDGRPVETVQFATR
jgi:eukaryotic-like serine/threonine-protein kinase